MVKNILDAICGRAWRPGTDGEIYLLRRPNEIYEIVKETYEADSVFTSKLRFIVESEKAGFECLNLYHICEKTFSELKNEYEINNCYYRMIGSEKL